MSRAPTEAQIATMTRILLAEIEQWRSDPAAHDLWFDPIRVHTEQDRSEPEC